MNTDRKQRFGLLVVIGLCLLLSACTSSKEAARDEPEPTVTREEPPPEPRRLPEPRRAEPKPEPPPKKREPVRRTVQGFRIQILTTADKGAADDQIEEALSWWQSMPASQRPAALADNELDVDVMWRSPYYRVRMGNFTSRAEAQKVLPTIKKRFGDAFIVPDTVVIWQ